MHDIPYIEYLGDVVLHAAIRKHVFLFTDSDMLAHPEFNYHSLYGTTSGKHFIPYRDLIRVGHVDGAIPVEL